MARQLLERGSLGAGAQAQDRTRDLSRRSVGHPDDGHLRDSRMVGEHVLDLARTDVLALADDDVLLAARDAEIALAVERAQVAGAEPPVGGEGVRVARAIEVAEAALRSACEDLALLPGRHRQAVVVDDPDLVGADRPALAVDATSRRVVGPGRGDRWKLRGAVDAL